MPRLLASSTTRRTRAPPMPTPRWLRLTKTPASHGDNSIRVSMSPKGQKPALDDNLIIHGDNLLALKALLPVYAGKVDCIFIDPPYNTGTEGWCYNNNVRSPLMREWIKKSGNPVEKEDLERHRSEEGRVGQEGRRLPGELG